MPGLKQHVSILKNGIPKRKHATGEHTSSTLPTRDHYERWSYFEQRKSPRSNKQYFADKKAEQEAVFTSRDEPLGIIDTVAREYIIHWMPEVILLQLDLDSNPIDQSDVDIYKSMVINVQHNVLDVAYRFEGSSNKLVVKIAKAILRRAEVQMCRFYDIIKHALTEADKQHFKPKGDSFVRNDGSDIPPSPTTKTKSTAAAQSLLTDARILDSSLAWDINDGPRGHAAQITSAHQQNEHKSPLSSPMTKKRRFSQVTYSPDIAAADNGDVWRDSSPDFTIKLAELETRPAININFFGQTSSNLPFSFRMPMPGLEFANGEIVDLTQDSGGKHKHEPNESGHESDDYTDEDRRIKVRKKRKMETNSSPRLKIPGTLIDVDKTSGSDTGKCLVM